MAAAVTSPARRRRAAAWALAAFLAAGGEGCGGPSSDSAGDQAAAGAAAERRLPVHLYFPGADGRLHAERRDLAARDDAEAQARAVLEALLAGPEGPDLMPVFPEAYGEIGLGTVLLGRDGVLLVDLATPDGAPPPSTGSLQEIVTVYALVNSVTLNVPAARRVALLWNGSQRESFAGHLDTTHPLGPDPSLVAR